LYAAPPPAAFKALPLTRTPATIAAALSTLTDGAAAAPSASTDSGGVTEPEGEYEDEEEAGVAEAIMDLQPTTLVPEDPHVTWLLEQLQALVDAGADADDSKGMLPAPGTLKGRRVAFALLEEMAIQGAKGSVLKMPAGVYQVSCHGVGACCKCLV
jgi:hypothetical protein